jgi:hypothetical protein
MDPDRISDHITLWRMWFSRLLEVRKETGELRAGWDALGLLGILTDEHFVGANAGITKDEFVAAISTIEVVLGAITGGHATNLYKTKE